jgi:hypothetical protein
VPPGVVTRIGPDLAPFGTTAVIEVAELTVKLAPRPLNDTDVAPVKLVPLIATDVPALPLVGVKPLIVGPGAGAVTVKLDELVALPPGAVTPIGPLVAVAGTVAVSCESETTLNDDDGVPLNVTAVVPVKPLPLIDTDVPGGPLVGEKPLIEGAAGGVTAPQPGSWNEPIRVSQLSSAFVVGWAS